MQAQYSIGPMTPEEQRVQAMRDAARHELISRQNMLPAFVGGLIGAAIGAALWGAIIVVTQWKIGIVAIAVGWLAGQLAWRFGRGLSPIYGLAGAVCAVLGCLAGNVLSACHFASQVPDIDATFWQLAGSFNFPLYWALIKITFSPMDVLFYLIALYEGWKLSFRRLAI